MASCLLLFCSAVAPLRRSARLFPLFVAFLCSVEFFGFAAATRGSAALSSSVLSLTPGAAVRQHQRQRHGQYQGGATVALVEVRSKGRAQVGDKAGPSGDGNGNDGRITKDMRQIEVHLNAMVDEMKFGCKGWGKMFKEFSEEESCIRKEPLMLHFALSLLHDFFCLRSSKASWITVDQLFAAVRKLCLRDASARAYKAMHPLTPGLFKEGRTAEKMRGGRALRMGDLFSNTTDPTLKPPSPLCNGDKRSGKGLVHLAAFASEAQKNVAETWWNFHNTIHAVNALCSKGEPSQEVQVRCKGVPTVDDMREWSLGATAALVPLGPDAEAGGEEASD